MSPTLDPNETLYVFDGTAFLFRSYFGKIRMTSPENVQVGAVMGLCMTVAKLVSMTRPTYLAAVFDAGRFTFRNQIDSGYKANRGDPPEDLVPQFPLAQAAIQALGIPTFSVPGYEADDLMATLAKRMEEQRFNTVLVASDKDLMQLIRPGVWVMDPRTYGLVGAPEVEARRVSSALTRPRSTLFSALSVLIFLRRVFVCSFFFLYCRRKWWINQ